MFLSRSESSWRENVKQQEVTLLWMMIVEMILTSLLRRKSSTSMVQKWKVSYWGFTALSVKVLVMRSSTLKRKFPPSRDNFWAGRVKTVSLRSEKVFIMFEIREGVYNEHRDALCVEFRFVNKIKTFCDLIFHIRICRRVVTQTKPFTIFVGKY